VVFALASLAARPAAASVPDAHGFALVVGGVASLSQPAGVVATPIPPQNVQVQVTFPGLGGKGGVVHVTAIGDKPHACQVLGFWSDSAMPPNELVTVGCYSPSGQALPSDFSVSYARSSDPLQGSSLYSYVDSDKGGNVLDSYNSAGASNDVKWLSTGVYAVQLNKLNAPAPAAGSLQVTAVNPNDVARCKPDGWTSSPVAGQKLQVHCYNALGLPADTRWNLSYHYLRSLYGGTPATFGYLWYEPPLGPAETDYNSSGAANTFLNGSGFFYITFPGLAGPPENIQVTAYGKDSQFCQLNYPWRDTPSSEVLVRDVTCFDAGGQLVDTGFFIGETT
jgi:hypothetical protein